MAGAVEGNVVAVTGGGRGIGLAIVRQLLSAGAAVGAGDIDLTDQQSALADLPGRHAAFALDVTDRDSFERFLDGVEQELGPIDVLINNAGVMALGPFHKEPDAVSRKTLAVNVEGPMIGMKLAIARMLERGSGHIINIVSVDFCAAQGPRGALALADVSHRDAAQVDADDERRPRDGRHRPRGTSRLRSAALQRRRLNRFRLRGASA